jgi:hypothetical protein
MSTALSRVARELQPDLNKWAIEADGENRRIVWRDIVIDLHYGTPARDCRRKLKKIISAAEKIDRESRQSTLIDMDQVEVAERSILTPELFKELMGDGKLQVNGQTAESSQSGFDGVVRLQEQCESCADFIMVANNPEIYKKEFMAEMLAEWPNLNFDEWDFSIKLCKKCFEDCLYE